MDDTEATTQREAALEERVAELEATVSEMLPGRRRVLKGAGAVGLLGLGASGAAAEASTTDQDGDVGSPDNRIDVFADGIDARSVCSDRERIGSPTNIDSGPIQVRHDEETGVVLIAQNHKDDGTNSDRKCKFWFYNQDGSERLAEFAPSETKEIVSGEKGVEWSSYLRKSRLSEAQDFAKWLRVEQASDAASDGFFYPMVEVENAEHFAVQGPGGENTKVEMQPTHANATQYIAFLDDNFSSDFQLSHNLEYGQFTFKDGRSGNAVMSFELGQDHIKFFGTSTEGVVWNADSTSNRPSNPTVGQRFFDTDLGQPIWYDGSTWVDATGTSV